MKKYKLICEYPGSPKLGTEVFQWNYLDKNSSYNFNGNLSELLKKEIIENSPKYWEEIIEFPIGTKIKDTNPDTEGYVYEKLADGKWKYNSTCKASKELFTNYVKNKLK